MEETPEKRRHASQPAAQPANERKLLRTGAYLHAYCPACDGDLIEGDWIRFQVTTADGSVGDLMLSPRFNVFDRQMTVAVHSGSRLRDLQCPRCHASLIEAGKKCEFCGSQVVRFRIVSVRIQAQLHVCSRAGCHWHDVADEDRPGLILENET